MAGWGFLKYNFLIAILSFLFVDSLCCVPFDVQKKSNPKLIGISNLWVGNDINKALIRIIVKNLEKQGHSVFSMNALGNRQKQKLHVEMFIRKKFDGIIIKGGVGDDFLELSTLASKKDIPLVGVEMTLPGSIAAVGSPDFTYKNLCNWLIGQMHQKDGYIVITNKGWHPLDAREKFALETMKSNKNLHFVDGKSISIGLDDPINENYEAIKKAIVLHPEVTGVIATWGIPVVSAAKAIMDLGRQKDISVIGCDADMALLALMAKKESPKIAIMGWRAEEMSDMASDIMNRALKIEGVLEIKKAIRFSHKAMPFFVTNTKSIDVFYPHPVMTPKEAWIYLYPKRKRPW
jgi:DNA-binding LacI/PurR family transcriptional regulator